ncbi:DUF4085 family protein [Paenibacillus sp. MMS18-CY102]|uniref:DUF4085 family protein n=1 Tax=Paenibacillus sp. MMS18-CY102 TaxID=2682849 RepID=UPI0013661384|nr:DUF4085 family protein [Paenibacillus sp. MMS18-CY102]MWC30327.1 DUF4085 family protein [Paenibacillus sp. MMS18-CY102]
MKYFTKELYEETQIASFLSFPETEKDWDENVAWHRSEGLDFEEMNRSSLEYSKKDLLKFLPEFFHPYIQEGTLNTQFPSEELRKMAEQWRSGLDQRMSLIGKECRGHYLSIKGSLPDNAVQLYEKSLHDARVLSLEMPSDGIFVMTLDCRGSMHYGTDIKVTFVGVKNLQPLDLSVGSDWISDEVYAAEGGFELHVLFENPLKEFTIAADNVIIEILS